MTREDFFESMNKLDLYLIERADGEAKVKKRSPILKIAAVAATFALVAAGVIAILPSLISGGENTTDDCLVWSDVFELFEPTGGNVTAPEAGLVEYAFAEITDKEYGKYEKGKTISEEFVGEKIDEIKVRTGWRMFDGKEHDVIIARAAVYEIKGTSPEAVVCIRYLEEATAESTEHYYAAVNTEYRYGTLAEFYADFGAETYMSVAGDVYIREASYFKTSTEKYRLNEEGAENIRKLLLSLDSSVDTEHKYDAVSEKMAGCGIMMRFQLKLDSAGTNIVFVYVLDNGYLAVAGIGEYVAFYEIGRSCADDFYATLKRGSDLIVSNKNDGGLVEETTSETVNEVVPE